MKQKDYDRRILIAREHTERDYKLATKYLVVRFLIAVGFALLLFAFVFALVYFTSPS